MPELRRIRQPAARRPAGLQLRPFAGGGACAVSGVREVIGTPAEVGRIMAQLGARGAATAMTMPEPVPGRPGLVRVQYLPVLPPMPRTPRPVPRGLRPRVVAAVAGTAVGVLAGLVVAVVLLVRWLVAHPAALILVVGAAVGLVWLAAKVRRR